MRQHRAPLQGESCSPPNFSGFKLFKIDISYKLYDIDIYRSPKWKKIRFVVKKGASCIIMSFRETGRCLTVEWTREQLGEGTNQEGSLQMSAPGESPTPPARPPAPAGRRRRPQPRQLQPPAAAKASSGHLGLALGLWAESRSVLPWGFSPATPSLFLSCLARFTGAARCFRSRTSLKLGQFRHQSRAWPPLDLRVPPPPPPAPPRRHWTHQASKLQPLGPP